MIKFIIALTVILTASSASAQSKRSLKDIDKELKQTKSTATALALIESIAEAVPQTEEDVAVLGQLMNKYATQVRKALTGIKEPKLAKAIIKECQKQVDGLQLGKGKNWDNLPQDERRKQFERLLNTYAYMAALGDLKNKEAVPFLKQYVTPEYDGALSYSASLALGGIGDEAALDEMVRDIGKTKEIDLSAFGDKAFVRIIKELDEPGATPKRKFSLIDQINGSRNPERKKALKELALKHKDEDVRSRSGQALINSMLLNPEESDSDFLYEWVPKATNDPYAGWSLTALRIHFPDKNKPLEKRFIPVLIEVLNKALYRSERSEAAELLGLCKIKESLPVLEECIVNDNESTVRTNCRYAYWEITGTVLLKFHPADVVRQEEYYKQPHIIEAFAKKLDSNPKDKYSLALKLAFEEYKRNQK